MQYLSNSYNFLLKGCSSFHSQGRLCWNMAHQWPLEALCTQILLEHKPAASRMPDSGLFINRIGYT